MRIAIGALGHIAKTGGGATVLHNMLYSLCSEFPTDEYHVLVSSGQAEHLKGLKFENLHVVEVQQGPAPWSTLWTEQYVIPRLLRKLKADAAFFPNSTSSWFLKIPTLLMVQARMFHFEQFDTLQKKVKNWLIRISVRRAPVVAVASESHRQDLVHYLGLAPDKVRVVPLGVDSRRIQETSTISSQGPFLLELGITKQYALFVSVLRPYKNLETAIRAFELLLSSNNHDMQLVIVGGFESAYKGAVTYEEQIRGLVNRCGLKERVLFLGNRSTEDVCRLYGAASVFLFPSRFEGFGLPVLEAMAAGVPVVASNAYSIPEVACGAALLIEPDNSEGFAEAMLKILSNSVERDAMVAKGYDVASRYTWRNSAIRVRTLLEELVEQHQD